MNYKVICKFNYSLVETFHYLMFSFVGVQKLLEYWFGLDFFREEGFVKTTLSGGA